MQGAASSDVAIRLERPDELKTAPGSNETLNAEGIVAPVVAGLPDDEPSSSRHSSAGDDDASEEGDDDGEEDDDDDPAETVAGQVLTPEEGSWSLSRPPACGM